MRIAIIGTGYVGLVTGTCFAETGNQVWCVDIDKEKIQALENGRIPIYEPELETMIQNNRLAGRLCFTTDISEALAVANICFIAVGTPMREDGGVELRYVMAVAHDIGRVMAHHVYVVNKSTVPVGTAGLVRAAVQGELEKRRSALTFDVISNPEFLKEGSAIGVRIPRLRPPCLHRWPGALSQRSSTCPASPRHPPSHPHGSAAPGLASNPASSP